MLFWLLLTAACTGKIASLEASPTTHTTRGRNTVRMELADALLDAGNTEEAKHLLALAAEERAPEKEIALRQARAQWIDGLPDAAHGTLLQLANDHPRDPRPLRWAALIEAETGNTQDALLHLLHAVELSPRDAASWNNLGFLRLSTGDVSGSVDALTRAVSLDRAHPRYRTNLGYALAAAQRDDAALATFRELGDEATAHAHLGFARELRDDASGAAAAYRRALELRPEQPAAAAGLRRLHVEEEG